MKKLILLITILAFNLNAWSAKTVDYLQDRGGIFYEINAEQPFTGKFLHKYANGQKKIERNYKDGKHHGLATLWHENGQKEVEGNSKDGKKYGLWTWWHENVQKSSEGNYKDDKLHGLRTVWHENGQKWFETNYKDGKENGLVTFWHENGQKEAERNYKNGKENGLSTLWYKNGQKESEINYKNGEWHGLWISWRENGKKKFEKCYKNGNKIALSKCAKNSGNKMKESLLNETGVYIAYPTSAVLKSIYPDSKTKVNNKHTKVGITENSFKSRSKDYHKDFNNEVVFKPLVIITNLSELVKREEDILKNIKDEGFSKVGQTKEWFDTENREKIKEIIRNTIIKSNIKYEFI